MAVRGVVLEEYFAIPVRHRGLFADDVLQTASTYVPLQNGEDCRCSLDGKYLSSTCGLSEHEAFHANVCAYIDANVILANEVFTELLELRLEVIADGLEIAVVCARPFN